jgi:hypothetical protein
MKLAPLAEQILEYRKAKGLASETDLGETVKGVLGKANELLAAAQSGDKQAQKKALVDLAVWTIGGFGVSGTADGAWDAIEARVAENATRTFSSEAAKS